MVFLPRHIHQPHVIRVGIDRKAQLLAEKIRVTNLNQRLRMPIPDIDQVNGVAVARDHVRKLGNLLGEERFDIRGMRVEARVGDVLRFVAWSPLHQVDSWLVPDRY